MFFVTTIQIKEEEITCKRTVGYFKTLEEAKNVLEHNCCDIYEYYYNYAVIEKVPAGLYKYDRFPIWYKWNKEKDGYVETEIPECAKNQCGFSIG